MALRLQLLGPFEAWRDGAPIPPAAWRGHKTRDLLKCLVLARGQYVSTDQLCDWLWPEAAPDAAQANLRSAVSDLRRLLEPGLASGRASAFIHTRREGYRFNFDAPVSVDWLDLERALASPDAAVAEAALARWPGELLPEDPYAEWACPARERLQALRLDAWAALADRALAAGDHAAAVRAAENGLALDTGREALWRALMRAHHLGGDRAAALRAFDRCRAALARDLGTDPLPETLALHQQILQDDGSGLAATAPRAGAVPAAQPAWLFRLAAAGLLLWVLATAAQLLGMLLGWLRGSLVSPGDPGAEALPRLLAGPAALAELHGQRYLLVPLGLLLLPAYAAWFSTLRPPAGRRSAGGLAWLGLAVGVLDVLGQVLSRVVTVAQVSVLPGAYAAAGQDQQAMLITLWDLLRALASSFATLSAVAHPLAVGLLAAATLFAVRRGQAPFPAARPLAISGLVLYALLLVYNFLIPGAPWAVGLGLLLAAGSYAWLLALAAAFWRKTRA
jgi:DNA-binding SARP family transcriptional activator